MNVFYLNYGKSSYATGKAKKENHYLVLGWLRFAFYQLKIICAI